MIGPREDYYLNNIIGKRGIIEVFNYLL